MPDPLTPLRIRSITPPETGRLDIADGAMPGLCLRVSAHEHWIWTLRMRGPDGRLRRFVLGDFSQAQGLAWARRQAERTRQQVRHEGRDPQRERRELAALAKAEAARLTLGALVQEWRERRLVHRRPRYADDALRRLRRAFGAYWDRPADDLTAVTVNQILADVLKPRVIKRTGALSKPRPAVARSTGAYGRACFTWASKHHLVQANPFATVPFEDFRVESRERFLSDSELAAVWRAADALDNTFARLVKLLILTGQRREEVAGMAWGELSPDRATWTLPRSRAKNGKVHIVPLPPQGRALLPRDAPDDHGPDTLVFPGQRKTTFSGWSKCKAQLDAAVGIHDWRLHDLRRTLATGLQRLGVRLEVTEAVLNHVSGSRAGIVGIYQRHDWAHEKRDALEAWAAHVDQILVEQERKNSVADQIAA